MEAGSSSGFNSTIEEEAPIRENLSHMSLEELQQLKEKLGTKIFDMAMFGSQPTKKKLAQKYSNEEEKHCGRRARHNMPEEKSSKILPRRVLPVVKPITKPRSIDPRFDPLFGTYDPEAFKSDYSFINEQKEMEILELQEQLKMETDPRQKRKIDFGIKKMENELREEERLEKRKKLEEELHQNTITALKSGQKAETVSKTDLRALELVEKYEKMKQEGKVLRSIAKQRQRIASRKRVKFDKEGLGRS